ncbi:MAG: type VI secretion system tip protein VgrG [Xanthomonadaceae bacterium]|jgi:type VI secretion system secreted protein VgrG|nr:type VI secretion system tip protein VgrG [Xanthomonadaceae bacterium]
MADIYSQSKTLAQLDRQTDRLLRLRFPQGDGPSALLLPERLDAVEGLSRDFRYTVKILSDDASIPTKELMGKMVTVELVRKDGSVRYFNGYVFEFRRVGTDGGMAIYEMVLGPWLAYLRLRKDNYLFHNKNIADQTTETFQDYEARDYEMKIIGDDHHITLATQWDETDYNYLHRRWEARGWYYWYEHRADGHTLVLSDDSSQATDTEGSATVRYHADQGNEDADGVNQWSPVRQLASSSYSATSFDFKKPRPQEAGISTINNQGNVPTIEVYEHVGAYGFRDAQHGDQLTRLRMEEIEAQARYFNGAGDCARLQPGRCFELTEHYEHDKDSSDQRRFLVIEVQHSASNNYLNQGIPAVYSNQFSASRVNVPWHPGRSFNSNEPKIYGLMTAIVVGPKGEEIYCDEYGRVRVQFHFDREGDYDENSSCWIRVSSSWAGERFGFMALPRIGQEVLVQFLGGNPDMPLITGRVYNDDNRPPWELPANKTQTGYLTRSTPGGSYSNANAIRFEDKKGLEQLWIHAERNQDIEVENCETHWVGINRTKTIGVNETNFIGVNRTETVGVNETITVGVNRTETIGAFEAIQIGAARITLIGLADILAVGAARIHTVGLGEFVTVLGARFVTVGLAAVETVGLAKTVTVGGAMIQTVGLGKIETIGGAVTKTVGLGRVDSIATISAESVGGAKALSVGGAYAVSVGGAINQAVGAGSLEEIGSTKAILAGTAILLSAGGSLIMICGAGVIIKGKLVAIN